MNSLTPLRRHSIRRPLIRLGPQRRTLRRRPEFILPARSLICVSLLAENIGWHEQRQPFKPQASALAGIVPKLVRLDALGWLNSADQDLGVAVHNRILNAYLWDVRVQAELEKRSSFAHSGPACFIRPVRFLSSEIEPQHAAITQETAFWVRDEQIPESLGLRQQIAEIALVVERTTIIRRYKIATPSIMAALAEGFAHHARPLTSHEDAHALPSFVFWVLVASILGGKPAQRLRSAQAPWEVSCRQPRIGQPFTADSRDHAVEPLKRVPFDVAFVQPEGELVQIAAKVLAAHAVINAVVAAFQDSPDAFNRVRVCRASRVLASRMIDGIVLVEQAVQSGENQVLIGIELRSEFDIVMDALRCLLQATLWHRGSEGSACPVLPHSENGCLADRPTPSLEFLVFVLVARFSADEAFVQFHDALELHE